MTTLKINKIVKDTHAEIIGGNILKDGRKIMILKNEDNISLVYTTLVGGIKEIKTIKQLKAVLSEPTLYIGKTEVYGGVY